MYIFIYLFYLINLFIYFLGYPIKTFRSKQKYFEMNPNLHK